MRRLILLLSLFPALAFAAPEAPPQALKNLPPLPQAAATNLDCSHGAVLRKKVEEIGQRAAASAQAVDYNAPMASMTPAQMEALQALTDPAFSMCPIEVMQGEAAGWSVAPEQKLDARLAEIHQAKHKSDFAYCEARPKSSMDCYPDPTSAKRFNAQATAAGTQYLKDMQPGYGKLLKQTGDCLALRDKPVTAAQGVTGAFAAMAQGALAQDWGLVATVAEANSRACEKAKAAAATYLEP